MTIQGTFNNPDIYNHPDFVAFSTARPFRSESRNTKSQPVERLNPIYPKCWITGVLVSRDNDKINIVEKMLGRWLLSNDVSDIRAFASTSKLFNMYVNTFFVHASNGSPPEIGRAH